MENRKIKSERQNRLYDGVALSFRRQVVPLLLRQSFGEITSGCPFRWLGLMLLLKEDSSDAVLAFLALDHVGTTNLGQGKYRRLYQAALQCVESLLLLPCRRDRVFPVGRAFVLQHVGQVRSELRKVLYKAAVEFEGSKKAPNDRWSFSGVFYRPDRRSVKIETKGHQSNALAMVLNFFLHEQALIHLELDTCVLRKSQHRVQML